MASSTQSSSVHNRHYLLCPVCKKTYGTLSVHLRRVCMKKATPEAITDALDRAKAEVYEILQFGRVFNYGLLRSIMSDADPLSRLLEELERRHMVVTDVPPPQPKPETSVRPSTVSETEESESSGEGSSSETSRCEPGMQRKNQSRKLMAEKGLYNKHSLDHPLLKDFATFLEKDLHYDNFKQEAENVARFLYYIDPQEPSLLFVRNKLRIKRYLSELSEAKLTNQTRFNYLKSLRRFLQYHTINTNLRDDDEKLHRDCQFYIEHIRSLQKSCSKLVRKKITKKRHNVWIQKTPLTPQDCWTVLKRARKDFMAVIFKVFPEVSATLELTECAFMVFYLEALVILKHLQQPGVVEHMRVQEWIDRQHDGSDHAVISVKLQKTAAQHVATFALSVEEELWFDIYFTHVRPQRLVSKRSKRKRDDVEGEDRFFISASGKPIYNASNDLIRLHYKYQLQPVSYQMARKVFKTAAKTLGDAEKSLVVDYLARSAALTEKHYRMKQSHNVVKAGKLLCKMANDSSAESGDEVTSHAACGSACNTARNTARKTLGCNQQMAAQAAYDTLLETHPVTVGGKVPNKELRSQTSPKFQRQLYERWLKAQMKLRVQHVLSHFGRQLPSEKGVSAWIAKQGWKSNIPTAARIINEWKLPGSVDTDISGQ